MLGEPEFFAPRAPVDGTPTAPQSITATVASTVAQAISPATPQGGALYEFVAAALASISFGLAAVDAATTADWQIGTEPRRLWIDPNTVTHIRAIRHGAADVIVSFHQVR